jgi:hypothetical protein
MAVPTSDPAITAAISPALQPRFTSRRVGRGSGDGFGCGCRAAELSADPVLKTPPVSRRRQMAGFPAPVTHLLPQIRREGRLSQQIRREPLRLAAHLSHWGRRQDRARACYRPEADRRPHCGVRTIPLRPARGGELACVSHDEFPFSACYRNNRGRAKPMLSTARIAAPHKCDGKQRRLRTSCNHHLRFFPHLEETLRAVTPFDGRKRIFSLSLPIAWRNTGAPVRRSLARHPDRAEHPGYTLAVVFSK